METPTLAQNSAKAREMMNLVCLVRVDREMCGNLRREIAQSQQRLKEIETRVAAQTKEIEQYCSVHLGITSESPSEFDVLAHHVESNLAHIVVREAIH